VKHEETVAKATVKGQIYSWGKYVSWGMALVYNGYDMEPPEGRGPSERISRYEQYSCIRCHNVRREDTNRQAMSVEVP